MISEQLSLHNLRLSSLSPPHSKKCLPKSQFLHTHKKSSLFKEEDLDDSDKVTEKQNHHFKTLIPYNFEGIKNNRATLIDWLIDACSILKLSWEVLWCAIQLLDFLIIECHCVGLKNIHLTGGCCLFLATKARHRCHWKKLPLEDLMEKVFHQTFKKKQILQKQAQIVMKIGEKGQKSKHFSTIYDQNVKQFEVIPKTTLTEVLRQLIIVWIDPGKFFQVPKSYQELFKETLERVEKGEECSKTNQLTTSYANKYECANFLPGNRKLKKLQL